jgi:hypothetical protein
MTDELPAERFRYKWPTGGAEVLVSDRWFFVPGHGRTVKIGIASARELALVAEIERLRNQHDQARKALTDMAYQWAVEAGKVDRLEAAKAAGGQHERTC